MIALFHELADRSPAERERYYSEHQVSIAIRAELEALLHFDRTSDHSLDDYAASAARQVLIEHSAPPEGARCGPYRLLRLVGRGGMGAGVRGRAGHPRRTVALKVINRPSPARNCCAVLSRNRTRWAACTIRGSRKSTKRARPTPASAPQPYFAMEFIRGETL